MGEGKLHSITNLNIKKFNTKEKIHKEHLKYTMFHGNLQSSTI